MTGATTGLMVVTVIAAAVVIGAWPPRRHRPARRLASVEVRRRPTAPEPGLSPGRRGAAAPAAGSRPWSAAVPPIGSGAGSRIGRLPRLPVDRLRLVAVLAGAAVAMPVGGWFGLLAGAGVAVAADRGLRRLEPAAVSARRLAEAAELPLAADLLAVALRGGAPADRATAAVAEALAGPLGERFAQVSRMLTLGAAPPEAWAQLAPVTGAARLVRAAVRSAEHGGALADAFGRLADDLRADRAIAMEAAARRAGVLIVLPLGTCFLPAFMLAGLVPVIIAVLGDVL
jgi:Flp pilus assembly protein TadB